MLPGTSLSDYLQMLGCLQSICVLNWRNLGRLMWLIVPEFFHFLNGFNISSFFHDM